MDSGASHAPHPHGPWVDPYKVVILTSFNEVPAIGYPQAQGLIGANNLGVLQWDLNKPDTMVFEELGCLGSPFSNVWSGRPAGVFSWRRSEVRRDWSPACRNVYGSDDPNTMTRLQGSG